MSQDTKVQFVENTKLWDRKQRMINDALNRHFVVEWVEGDMVCFSANRGHYGYTEVKTIWGSSLFPKFLLETIPKNSGIKTLV